jgi:hypothetical protein
MVFNVFVRGRTFKAGAIATLKEYAQAIKYLIKKEGCKENDKTLNYDKDKYREMVLDAAETVLGYFGFNRTVYENPRYNRKKKKWYEELREERTKDIQAERMMIEKQ